VLLPGPQMYLRGQLGCPLVDEEREVEEEGTLKKKSNGKASASRAYSVKRGMGRDLEERSGTEKKNCRRHDEHYPY